MLESLFVQVAHAATNATVVTTTPPGVVESFQALIVAVASIMGTVGAILHTLSQRGELKSHKAALQSAADFLKDVSDHVVASKDDIKTLADVTYKMLPEQAEQIVNAQNVRISELTKKLEIAQSQLSKVPAALDHI
jgi:hypothetical protein